MSATDLSEEIAAFMRQKPKLIADYGASWVVFVRSDLKGHFDRFDQAADFAVSHHGSERFLIRHTTEPPPQVPLLVVEN